MNIAIIDAELAEKPDSPHNRFPNLACMKLSSFHKAKGHNVKLLLNYDDLEKYDKVYVSKVFTSTGCPNYKLQAKNIEKGGTGFFYDKYDNAPMLPYEIEHSKPDYKLYESWVKSQKDAGIADKVLKYYTDYSIGFTTRGCFRKCPFCVNRNSNAALLASPISEFFDINYKKICLLDDNVFAFKGWKAIFDELHKLTEKHKTTFEYKQGLDIRLLTDEKAIALASSRYSGHFIFAFDNIKDKPIIDAKCALFRRHIPNKNAKFYVFCGYESQDAKDIATVFERIKILWNHECLAFIMHHENYKKAPEPYRNMYVQLGRWCNQPQFQWTKSIKEFCEQSGGKAYTELLKFEEIHPNFKEDLDRIYPQTEYKNNLREKKKMEQNEKLKRVIDNKNRQIDALIKVVEANNNYVVVRESVTKENDEMLVNELTTDNFGKLKKKPSLAVTDSTQKNKTSLNILPSSESESEIVADEVKSPAIISEITEIKPEASLNIEPAKSTVAVPAINLKPEQSIEVLKLNANQVKVLKDKKLDTIEKIIEKTKEEFHNETSFRNKTMALIETGLKSMGLDFKGLMQETAEQKI